MDNTALAREVICDVGALSRHHSVHVVFRDLHRGQLASDGLLSGTGTVLEGEVVLDTDSDGSGKGAAALVLDATAARLDFRFS